MPGYRIVATGIKEFDYPKGNDNVYTSYTGKGGISLHSFWKRPCSPGPKPTLTYC